MPFGGREQGRRNRGPVKGLGCGLQHRKAAIEIGVEIVDILQADVEP